MQWAKKSSPKSSDVTMIETFREERYIKSRPLILGLGIIARDPT